MNKKNDKLQQFVAEMMNEFGFNYPVELVAEYRKKKIVVVDENRNVVEVLRDSNYDENSDNKQ